MGQDGGVIQPGSWSNWTRMEELWAKMADSRGQGEATLEELRGQGKQGRTSIQSSHNVNRYTSSSTNTSSLIIDPPPPLPSPQPVTHQVFLRHTVRPRVWLCIWIFI